MTEVVIGPLDGSFARLSEPENETHDLWGFHLELTGPRFSAEAETHTDATRLIEFLQGLAETWRGWEGDQTWEGVDHDLRIHASRDRSGHVLLRVSVDQSYLQPTWRAEVMVRLDAGEDMKRLARDMEVFFSSGA